MPTGQHIPPITNDQPQPDHQPQAHQIKACSLCLSPLLDAGSTAFYADAIVCRRCRDHGFPRDAISLPTDGNVMCVDADPVRHTSHETEATGMRRMPGPLDVADEHADTTGPLTALSNVSECEPSINHPPIGLSVFTAAGNRHLPLTIDTGSSPAIAIRSQIHVSSAPNHNHRRHDYSTSSPDPLVDITRLRVRSQTRHCLYPGASFQGTQKSGRNSYDVTVTIVDVDFSSSFLCGYLRICGLTDDWPELTTYFDAEIIGSRYGFLTQNWGANEQEDMVHWARFPAFRNVKHEVQKPYLTISDRDCGAVFMRWKERFLVPDHRVQDISGASFAGFYYVCVDFNPPPPVSAARPATRQMAPTPDDNGCPLSLPSASLSPSKPETNQRVRRDSSARRTGRSPSLGRRSSPPIASMSGFYFHQNSEPYQQLSLSHVPERSTSSFEFR